MMRAIVDARLGEHADGAMELAVGNVSALLDGGATVIAGKDANETPFAPVPHGPSLHTELDFLVQAGMTGAEAIRATTSAAADAVELGDRGRIVVGARADLIVVNGDPIAGFRCRFIVAGLRGLLPALLISLARMTREYPYRLVGHRLKLACPRSRHPGTPA